MPFPKQAPLHLSTQALSEKRLSEESCLRSRIRSITYITLSLANPVPNSILLLHHTTLTTHVQLVHACLLQYKGIRLYSDVTVRNKVEEDWILITCNTHILFRMSGAQQRELWLRIIPILLHSRVATLVTTTWSSRVTLDCLVIVCPPTGAPLHIVIHESMICNQNSCFCFHYDLCYTSFIFFMYHCGNKAIDIYHIGNDSFLNNVTFM